LDIDGGDTAWLVRDGSGRTRDAGVNVRMRLDNFQAIADAAIAGLGLASLPNWLFALYLRTGELVLVMDGASVQPIEIHVIWSDSVPARQNCSVYRRLGDTDPRDAGTGVPRLFSLEQI
jgi:DNA-binding transcriptional LysR family regulator